jgi:hypothetical protein
MDLDFGVMKEQDRAAYINHWKTQGFDECFALLKKYGMVNNPCPSCTTVSLVSNATILGLLNKSLKE